MKTTGFFPRRLFHVVGLVCLLLSTANSQMKEISHPDVHSEGRYYLLDNILYCDAIVVKFKTEVIRLTNNAQFATRDNVESAELKAVLDGIQSKHGVYSIIKQIPGAKYGDVIRTNKRTGEQVVIADLSQLFTIRFSEPLELDRVINEFKKLKDVEYVHQPVSVVWHVEPNDTHYVAGDQWNLES